MITMQNNKNSGKFNYKISEAVSADIYATKDGTDNVKCTLEVNNRNVEFLIKLEDYDFLKETGFFCSVKNGIPHTEVIAGNIPHFVS